MVIGLIQHAEIDSDIRTSPREFGCYGIKSRNCAIYVASNTVGQNVIVGARYVSRYRLRNTQTPIAGGVTTTPRDWRRYRRFCWLYHA
ncbi:hypothetical protein OH492_10115 [Vibrio chagasii]|nr:hypothetical protein [Vibrio chagasii]